MLQGPFATAAAVVLAAAVTGFFAFVTSRAASKAAERSASTTSRASVELGAFERAESYYQGVIEDMGRRIKEWEVVHEKVLALNAKLRQKVNLLSTEMDGLTEDLTRCKEALSRCLKRKGQ